MTTATLPELLQLTDDELATVHRALEAQLRQHQRDRVAKLELAQWARRRAGCPPQWGAAQWVRDQTRKAVACEVAAQEAGAEAQRIVALLPLFAPST